MSYRLERPKRGDKPTVLEAKQALAALVGQNLRPEAAAEYRFVLEKVIQEWSPLAEGRESETHYCSSHAVDGRCSKCGRLERDWL